MATLQLSRGLVAWIDDEDLDGPGAQKWSALKSTRTFYAVRSLPAVGGRRPMAYLHRVLLNVTDPLIEVDHIDGNGLNNRRANLRLASKAENGRNRPANRHGRRGTSLYKGVHWSDAAGKWVAGIRTDGRYRHLGCFADEADAARAYDLAAVEEYAAYAWLNFPDLVEAG